MASTTNNNAETLQKFASCVALISPQHAAQISGMAQAPQRNMATTDLAMQQCASNYGIEGGSGKPFLFGGGVAVIPVWGVLLHRDRWCDEWATGYDFLHAQMSAALGDPDVKGIVWDINSYGGHVAGNFELCEEIYAARGQKPMVAMVDSMCFSGGYSIASAIGKIVVTPSSQAGSIGVVMMHTSYQEMMKNYGVEVTFVFAGDHKVDGNPYEKLPKAVKANMQASVDRSYKKFVDLVARNRGLDAQAAIDTEAAIFDADEAVAAGLIDEVMTPKAAYTSFLKGLATSPTPTKEAKKMTTNAENPGGEGGADTAAQLAAAKTAGIEEGKSAGAQAAKDRINAIMSSEHAKDKKNLASKLALETNVSVEDAVVALQAAAAETPVATAAAPTKGPLAAAMDGGANPALGAEGGEGEEEGQQASAPGAVAARITAAYRHANGIKTPAAAKTH